MAKSKFNIRVLDAYARKLTFNQAKRLYENKTRKQYKKALFESVPSYIKSKYTYYLDNSTIYDYCINEKLMNPDMVAEEITYMCSGDKGDMEYTVHEDGVIFLIGDEKTYDMLIEILEEDFEIPVDQVEANIDENFLNEN